MAYFVGLYETHALTRPAGQVTTGHDLSMQRSPLRISNTMVTHPHAHRQKTQGAIMVILGNILCIQYITQSRLEITVYFYLVTQALCLWHNCHCIQAYR